MERANGLISWMMFLFTGAHRTWHASCIIRLQGHRRWLGELKHRRFIMDSNKENETYEAHTAARPMKVVVDEKGCNWLCDREVDEGGDLEAQGCWRCSEMAFTRNS
jgi:hypothetical protein